MKQWTPMRWPQTWTDPSSLDLLRGSAIDFLLLDKSDGLAAVRARAEQQGIKTAETFPYLKGEWPGVRMTRGGGGVSAGPTGVPWVNSNGWLIRLETALRPGSPVWVDAPPPPADRAAAGAYLLAVADSAAYGGRWIVSLDDQLAAGIGTRNPQALDTWKKLAASTAFFAKREAWSDYIPVAVTGVVSSFQGDNEFFSRELLNLLDRAGQHYRILSKDRPLDLAALRAVIYADADPPPPALRQQFVAFVQSGGILITGPNWGESPGAPAKGDEHPRFGWRALGKGRIALAHDQPADPYEWANDAVVLVSHRYDLVRFWNGGATGSYVATAPDGKQSVAHLLFYANRGPDQASVRIAVPHRPVKALSVKAWTVEGSAMVEVQTEPGAIEVHLPQVSQYVALEMSDALPSNP